MHCDAMQNPRSLNTEQVANNLQPLADMADMADKHFATHLPC